MKKGLSLILFLFSAIFLHAQHKECGTGFDGFDISRHYAALKKGKQNLKNQKYWLPVAFHLTQNSKGERLFGSEEVEKQIILLNQRFHGAGIEFYACVIDSVQSDSLYNSLGGWSESKIVNAYPNDPDKIHVYIVNKWDKGVGGYAYLLNPHRTFLTYISFSDETTLTHEFGHLFGLLHTFETKFGAELANGSNCATAGDLICDTPADPNSWGEYCTYNGTAKDANNQPYAPKSGNFMAYEHGSCTYHFTPDQEALIVANTIDYFKGLSCLNGSYHISNDECASSMNLVSTPGTFDRYKYGTTIGAVNEGKYGPVECDDSGDRLQDIWYNFQALAPEHEISIVPARSGGQLIVSLYGGDCGAAEELACTAYNPDTANPFTWPVTDLDSGITYFIRIYAAAPFLDTMDIDIAVRHAGSRTYTYDLDLLRFEGPDTVNLQEKATYQVDFIVKDSPGEAEQIITLLEINQNLEAEFSCGEVNVTQYLNMDIYPTDTGNHQVCVSFKRLGVASAKTCKPVYIRKATLPYDIRIEDFEIPYHVEVGKPFQTKIVASNQSAFPIHGLKYKINNEGSLASSGLFQYGNGVPINIGDTIVTRPGCISMTEGRRKFCAVLPNKDDNRYNDTICKKIYVGNYDLQLFAFTPSKDTVKPNEQFSANYVLDMWTFYFDVDSTHLMVLDNGVPIMTVTTGAVDDFGTTSGQIQGLTLSTIGKHKVCLTIVDSLDIRGPYDTLCKNIVVANNSIGIAELQSSFNVTLHPNPANEIITLENLPDGALQYTMVNNTGMIVQRGSVDPDKNQIQLEELAPGIYAILLNTGQTLSFMKR